MDKAFSYSQRPAKKSFVNTKATDKKTKNTAKANVFTLTATHTSVTFKATSGTAKGLTYETMGKSMSGNEKMTEWKGQAALLILLATN